MKCPRDMCGASMNLRKDRTGAFCGGCMTTYTAEGHTSVQGDLATQPVVGRREGDPKELKTSFNWRLW